MKKHFDSKVYACVCVCVERERESEKETRLEEVHRKIHVGRMRRPKDLETLGYGVTLIGAEGIANFRPVKLREIM